MFNNILVVCFGNVCRSPVAEAMLRQQLPHCRVHSAGLKALVGQGADASSQETAAADGLDLSTHVARQLTSDMLQQADLILVMSHSQLNAVGEKSPTAMGKTMLLGHWLNKEIPDPYGKSRDVFQHVHNLIGQAVAAWSDRLKKNGR